MIDVSIKEKRYKVGYINGVFDLFHMGHLNIIKRCKQYCDYLIVGVNSDEISYSYKSKMPIIDENDRMAIIRELRCVDEVVLVDLHNNSSILAWELYHFDVQFCGDDHEGELQSTKEKLQMLGSDMVFFPYTERISSSKIRMKFDNKKEAYR